jgi:hypothetical protein
LIFSELSLKNSKFKEKMARKTKIQFYKCLKIKFLSAEIRRKFG